VRTAALLFAAALVAVATSAAYVGHALGRAEGWTIDRRFAIRGARTPKDVAVVAVDAASLGELHERWPLPRRVHAEVLRRVANDGPRAVAVDIQFTERTDEADDNALISAVADADRGTSAHVVLGTTEVSTTGHTAVLGGDAVVRRSGAAVGFIGLPVDRGGVLRQLAWGSSTTTPDGGPAVPLESIALVAAGRATGRETTRSELASPTTIAYAGPAGTVPTYSYADVLGGRVAESALAGKVVVIGATAPALQDVHRTPVGPMSGPEIQANAVETALHGFPLKPSRSRALLLIVLLSFLVPVASLLLRWRWCLLMAAVTAVLYLVAAQISFDHGVLLAVTWPLLALALGTLVAAFLRPRTYR